MEDMGPSFKVKRRKLSHKPSSTRDDNVDEDGGGPIVFRGTASNNTNLRGLHVSQHAPGVVHSEEETVEAPRNELSHGLLNRFVATQAGRREPGTTHFADRKVSETVYQNFRRETIPGGIPQVNNHDHSQPTGDHEKLSDGQTSQRHLSEVIVEDRQNKQPSDQDTASVKRRRKPRIRLGWDGKPMKPRVRQGPTAEDIERAKLVEELLHEQGSSSHATAMSNNLGNNQEADDQMANDFRSEFMSAVADKAQRQAAGRSTGERSAGATSTGPRLGGSRSARAKMAQQKAMPVSEK